MNRVCSSIAGAEVIQLWSTGATTQEAVDCVSICSGTRAWIILSRVNGGENRATYYRAPVLLHGRDFHLPEMFIEHLLPTFSAGGRASKRLLTISDVLRVAKPSTKALRVGSVDMYERTRLELEVQDD